MDTFFPVTYSTPSVRALVEEVLPGFGIGAVAECRYYSHGINDTYRIRCEDGHNYFLRVYRSAWRSFDDIAFELDALTHLQHKGFPVAYPLPYLDGRLALEVNAPEGRRYASLFIAAPGEEPDIEKGPDSPGMAYRYGKAVARMHNALQDFSSNHPRPFIDLDHLIQRPLRDIQPVLEGQAALPQAEEWEYVQRFAEKLCQRIQALPIGALEWGFCHGDLQGYHANLDTAGSKAAGDGTLTFYDFDCCGMGLRAYDLAVFRWCGRLKNQEFAWWEPYLRAYQEERPLNLVDILAVPLFICARHIWHMGLHTHNAYDWGYEWLNRAYFKEHLEWLRALEKDYLDTAANA
jgi:Ser/Thr protein kinase RdoA (MazF antagonist)